MYSASLVPLITADALRALIRAAGLLRELRPVSRSLPRALREQNCVGPLGLELRRLRGLADLLTPVSTTAETDRRQKRLETLFLALPPERTVLRVALDQGFEKVSRLVPDRQFRGKLIAAEELAMRAVEARLARQWGGAGQQFSAQVQQVLVSFNEESAGWRTLEPSWLVNRLVADHGFAETYGQARKRARILIKDQASGTRPGLKPRDVRALKRWHDSVAVQLESLVDAQAPGSELQDRLTQAISLTSQLDNWLAIARLNRLPELPPDWREATGYALQSKAEHISVLLQQAYGPGKSNFRSLIESEFA